ncbi:hypothetical protein NS228_05275 [Methylobacterium indicum]|uniref:hypothetical protein n=1 Tax=Methylobacterium indicum TaxID=1775910 RepID=UPI0007349939|nr:hypothetical protein [Methylobacterium indicum]KTS34224.1 hypothetical protein NS229_11450 [Methylobacterium indicum]KTS41792.1 hypothetical protein NS228_05275 [Methylobacterium indicum]KTS53112.1 hypothetical protein NS230_07700 [Methylobacterium indicum]
MTYHTSARDVADSFDTVLTTGALGLGSVLISQKLDRDAAYREAASIRQATARMAYRRVMAEQAFAEAERRALAEDDRRRVAIQLRALAAKRARG